MAHALPLSWHPTGRTPCVVASCVQMILLAILLAVSPPIPAAGDFTAGIEALKAQLAQGDHDAALVAGRSLLRRHRGDPAVTAGERSEVHQLLLDAAQGAGNLRTGNVAAADLLKHDRRAFGRDSVARVPGLYRIAGWHRWAGQNVREREAYAEAIGLLEASHGPRDPRLAPALTGLAAACIQGRTAEAEAREALARARTLAFVPTREDLLAKAEALATQGDLEVVFGDPAAGAGWYEAAWRTLADSTLAGRDLANTRFAVPRPLSVRIPDAPFKSLKGGQEHFARGRVAFGFTVTPEGRVADLRLREVLAPVESLPDPVIQAFRDARYRPRVQGGRVVATADHGYVLRFRDDPTLQPRKVKFGVLDGRY